MKLYRVIGQTVEAVQWNGTNEAEVRELLGDDRPFPKLGWYVVRRAGGISVYSPANFALNFEPLIRT